MCRAYGSSIEFPIGKTVDLIILPIALILASRIKTYYTSYIFSFLLNSTFSHWKKDFMPKEANCTTKFYLLILFITKEALDGERKKEEEKEEAKHRRRIVLFIETLHRRKLIREKGKRGWNGGGVGRGDREIGGEGSLFTQCIYYSLVSFTRHRHRRVFDHNSQRVGVSLTNYLSSTKGISSNDRLDSFFHLSVQRKIEQDRSSWPSPGHG